MSQKKAKKLRRIETVTLMETTDIEHVKGIRQILKENWKFLLFLSLGIFVLYFNSLHGDFVSDDYAAIPDNQNIGNFRAMIGNSSTFGIYIVYKLFGITNVIPHHFLSVLIYIFFVCLSFIIVELIFNSKKISRLSMVIFAVLPIHVEAVSWISGRIYLLLSIYIMFGFLGFILYIRNKNWKYLLITLITFILGFMTDKPRPFALFLLIFIYILYEGAEKIKIDWKKSIAFISVISIILIILVWPDVQNRINNVNSGYNGYGGIFYDPFFQYPTSIAKYLQLIFVPIDLTLYHTMYVLPAWLNWLIILSYLTAVVYFWFKDKKIFFALTFIFAATAPSMAPAKVSWLVAERYVFLGSLGFCLFLVFFFQRFSKFWKIPIGILFCLLIGIYSVRVYLRNIDWQTNHNLWVNTCQVSPNSHNAWNNIGDDYDKLAQLETKEEGKINQYLNSVKGFTQSVTVKQNYADAYHNRANIFYKIGRYDLAKDSYETALSYGSGLYQSYYSLLQIDLIEKNYNSAIDHLNRLNTVRPNDPQVYYAASVVYANMGKADQAISILEQLIKFNPGWIQAKELLDQLKNNSLKK